MLLIAAATTTLTDMALITKPPPIAQVIDESTPIMSTIPINLVPIEILRRIKIYHTILLPPIETTCNKYENTNGPNAKKHSKKSRKFKI